MESDAGFLQIFIGYWTSFPSWQKILVITVISGANVFVFLSGAFAIPSGCGSFLWLRNVASESRYSQRYRDVITRGLAWLGDSKRMSGPFSYRAFRVCLAMAVAYPMLFWLIAWVAGGSGDFAGTITLSPAGVEETSIGRRLLVLGVLSVLAVFYYYFFKNKDRFIAALISPLERMLRRKLPENMVRALGAPIAPIAIGALIVQVGALIAGVAFVQLAQVVAVVVVGALIAFIAFVVVVADVADVAGGAFVQIVAGVVGVTVVAVFSLTAVVAVGSLIAGVSFAQIVAGGMIFAPGDEFGAVRAVGAFVAIFWLTFYALLPVVNAFFDWLSLGASRRLIHHLLDRHSVWLAVLLVGVDLTLALLFMGIISLSIPFLLGAINSGLSTLENPVAIPWQETVEAARTAPWTAGLMATAMIVTTLIPTAVHLFAALVSLAPVDLSHTKLAKTSDQEAEALPPLGRAWTALQSFAIPIVFSWGILVVATIALLSLSQAAYQGGLGDLLIDWALASGTFAEGLF